MPSTLEALQAPFWIIEQATLNVGGLVVASIWIATMIGLIWRARVGWFQLWPMLTLPLPWLALAIWAGFHWRSAYGPQTGFHAEGLGIAALGLTLGLSCLALVRAEGVRLPAFGLTLLNIWFCLFAAFISVMATTGSWL
tara:strand:- start:348 stop:764 length:417 start_codon:yes stop_codon:yes gene_type:complete